MQIKTVYNSQKFLYNDNVIKIQKERGTYVEFKFKVCETSKKIKEV